MGIRQTKPFVQAMIQTIDMSKKHWDDNIFPFLLCSMDDVKKENGWERWI